MDDMVKKVAATVVISLRFTPRVKRALDKAAEEDRRPVATYIQNLVIEHLEATGYLK
jgi:hypothetical protein